MYKKLFIFLILFATLSDSQKFEKIGNGSPIIFVQGLGCSADVWDSTIAKFMDKYTCYKLNIPGFNNNQSIGSEPSEKIGEMILELIEDQKLDKPIIVGHSFGGFSVLKFASKYSELISKIVIVDASPYTIGAIDPNIPLNSSVHQAKLMSDALTKMSDEQYNNHISTALRQAVGTQENQFIIKGWNLNSNKKSILNSQKEMLSVDLRETTKNIKIPVLVFASSVLVNKQGIPESVFQNNYKMIYKNVNNCKFVFTKTANHFIMLDEPKWFYKKLNGFLSHESN